MSHNTKSTKRASALSAIRVLKASKVKAEALIADCLKHKATEEKMLRACLAEPKTSANKQCLELGKKACRTGIKAWKSSIKAFQNDISRYESEINAILKRVPGVNLGKQGELHTPLQAVHNAKKRRQRNNR